MNNDYTSILEAVKFKLKHILEAKHLLGTQVSIVAKPLTPEEAIGNPSRRDFPIIEGKERVVEAEVLSAKGHAFTDSPKNFQGTLQDVLKLPLTSNQNRSIFIAALNAILRQLEMVEGTVHCKDEDPEKCAEEIAALIQEKWGRVVVGLIGLNPAIAEKLVTTFGLDNVLITDLNQQNINKPKFGVRVWDGREETDKLIEQSDVVILTGTTLVNDTFDPIMESIRKRKKEHIIYGVTGAGICKMMDLNRICPYGRNQ